MDRTIIQSRVGADGILHVQVPLGSNEANRDVIVTIDPAQNNHADQDYSSWLKSIAGKWQGDFELPPSQSLEEREPLP